MWVIHPCLFIYFSPILLQVSVITDIGTCCLLDDLACCVRTACEPSSVCQTLSALCFHLCLGSSAPDTSQLPSSFCALCFLLSHARARAHPGRTLACSIRCGLEPEFVFNLAQMWVKAISWFVSQSCAELGCAVPPHG